MVLSKTNRKRNNLVTYEDLMGALEEAEIMFPGFIAKYKEQLDGLECLYLIVMLNSEPYRIMGKQLGIAGQGVNIPNMMSRTTAKLNMLTGYHVTGYLSLGQPGWEPNKDPMDASGGITTGTNIVAVDGLTPELNHLFALELMNKRGWLSAILRENISKEFEGYQKFAKI